MSLIFVSIMTVMTTNHIKTREEPTPESSGRPGLYPSGSVQCDGELVLFVCYDSENPVCQAHFCVTGQLDTRPLPVAYVEVQVKVRCDTSTSCVVWSAKGGHGIYKLPKTKVG
jgi:hypothetical protein